MRQVQPVKPPRQQGEPEEWSSRSQTVRGEEVQVPGYQLVEHVTAPLQQQTREPAVKQPLALALQPAHTLDVKVTLTNGNNRAATTTGSGAACVAQPAGNAREWRASTTGWKISGGRGLQRLHSPGAASPVGELPEHVPILEDVRADLHLSRSIRHQSVLSSPPLSMMPLCRCHLWLQVLLRCHGAGALRCHQFFLLQTGACSRTMSPFHH